ncbi:MAG: ATP-binding cassette domain-containing protein, partial [Magnetococcales bacterium]|nr:ATP-binding cassette domain-containing protein [Magnetococcales bacterium]
PDGGAIVVDGVPMERIRRSTWRRSIGYVPQDLFLFHDDIFTNVALGDESLTEETVIAALKEAEAWGFVKALEKGIRTNIGDKGSLLSGGQRQRISIARALVRKPRLLILDEITTALDADTEQAIVETLKRLAGRVTILVISHQPALVAAADHRFRIENRQIVEF